LRAQIDKLLAQIKESFGKMSRGSKIRLAILLAVVVILAIVAVSLLTRTNYSTLYIAADQAEAGRVYAALKEMNIPVDIDGTRILAPENRISELQAMLASQGIVGARGTDLSIMSGASGFGVTESYASKLFEAQKAEDIRTAILTSPKIRNADVIVNNGETSPFVRAQNAKPPSCSIMLTLNSGATLTRQEAQTIAEHVRASVQGISYENISISDSNLNHYRVGEDIEDTDSEMVAHFELQNRLNEQTKAAGDQLLLSIFGRDNVQVSVTVRLNFDKMVTETVKFEPPVAGELDGIIRSSSELREARKKDDAAGGVPGTDSNGMGTVEYPFGSADDNEWYEKALLERNYDINETRTLIEHAQGKVEYISVAVAINSTAVDEDYSSEVSNLVSAGLGIAPTNVKVAYIPFAVDNSASESMKAQEEYEARMRQRELIQTIIMWSVILILGLALMLLVRTIVRTVKPPPEPEPVLADGGYSIDYIADDVREEEEEEESIRDITHYEEVALQTKSTGLEQIERFIDKDPAAVAQLLRNWLTDE